MKEGKAGIDSIFAKHLTPAEFEGKVNDSVVFDRFRRLVEVHGKSDDYDNEGVIMRTFRCPEVDFI